MKKLILILISVLFILECSLNKINAQVIPDACNLCSCSLDNVHNISDTIAAKLIKKFKKKFKNISAYAGTIYGNEDYFKKISVQSSDKNYTTIKYHFCTNSKTSKNLFLAFENGECKPSTRDINIKINKNNEVGNCVKSNDQEYTKIKPKFLISLRCFRKRLIKDKEPFDFIYNNDSSQIITAADVNASINFLKENINFSQYISCSKLGGNFNFNESIHEIFLNGDPTGKDTICKGIRYYFGYDKVGKIMKKNNRGCNFLYTINQIPIVIVGVDEDGQNLRIFKENSVPN